MPETDASKAFEHLHKQLVEYQLRFVDVSLRGAGLAVLAIGWMLTSDSARHFIAANRAGRTAAVAGIVVMILAYLIVVTRMITVMQHLGGQLKALDYFPPCYYDFRVFPPGVAIATAAVALAPACIVVSLMLFGLQ